MKRDLVIVNRAGGRGKGAAACGMLRRARGRGTRTCAIQFIKAGTGMWGQVQAPRKLDFERRSIGDGFTWTSRDVQRTSARAIQGLATAKVRFSSSEYDAVLLDESTRPVQFVWLDTTEVIRWLKTHKPPEIRLVVAGREARQAPTHDADLVTDTRGIKPTFGRGIQPHAWDES